MLTSEMKQTIGMYAHNEGGFMVIFESGVYVTVRKHMSPKVRLTVFVNGDKEFTFGTENELYAFLEGVLSVKGD